MRVLFLVFCFWASAATGGSVPDALSQASAERQRVGLPPLTMNSRLAAAAEAQARHMARSQRIGHRGTGGSSFAERIRATGYPLCHGAENVAGGQRDATAVTRAWMTSPAHRANILNPRLTDGAVAAVRDGRGRLWWAMVLAGPC
ncbi:CAP domain-containing protein [Jannaschia marina]|uniref:CAP domain-containing protein n=1 Tax=Jannaschia marina TaxID=2741674 RepID=UPI0015CDCB50|nr:CAP domain-containing protein [Jannaschia marina]